MSLPKLTPQELAVMKVVWQLERATVREVHEALQQTRPLAYTTVLTMMRILEGKGYLRRDDMSGRAHVYTSTRPESDVVGGLVRDFVERVFDGAAQPLVMHLVKDRRLTDEERAEIARMLEAPDASTKRGRGGRS
jgi:BlaI family penicillinase repressor